MVRFWSSAPWRLCFCNGKNGKKCRRFNLKSMLVFKKNKSDFFPNAPRHFYAPHKRGGYNKIADRGFTLMEMLITIGIIIFLSGFVLVSSGGNNDGLRLKMAAQEIIGDLRRVQNFAISVKTTNSNIPDGGYGIRFDKPNGSYIIFSEEIANKVFDNTEQIEAKPLYQNIEFSDITVLSSGGVNILDAVFVPPDPVTYLNGNNNFNEYALITLRLKGKACPRFCRKIIIKTSGVIE